MHQLLGPRFLNCAEMLHDRRQRNLKVTSDARGSRPAALSMLQIAGQLWQPKRCVTIVA